MNLLFVCACGYLIGSIPSGFLLTKLTKGIDLRNFGSSSTGATNVLRTGDKKLAIMTLFFDVLKGFAFSSGVLIFFDELTLYISSFFCLIGHAYPIWLKFKGGKGVATVAGIFLSISPVITLISALIWGIVAKFGKISSIASLSFCFTFSLIAAIKSLNDHSFVRLTLFSISVFVFLLYTHHSNIKRLFSHEENNFYNKLKNNKEKL
ncbi:MAG: glycerol-3-phosphate 1-O-acyltransferase PlsY [Holosporales bacterium]|jgi:glycerol-3-phosphate acyltransferase PlsY|nr:glycerol-3-phosphate 1-O-acyltransferase PlsY [Holosporales bacterium]